MPRRARKPEFWDIDGPEALAQFRQRLQLATDNGLKDEGVLEDAINTVVGYHSVDVVRSLIEEEQLPVDKVTPESAARKPTTELLQLLIDHGWDINKRSTRNSSDGTHPVGQSFLQLVCGDEALVKWCLKHGASTQDVQPDFVNNPPLMEVAARQGSLETMKILLDEGAKLTPRVLHCAVDSAAYTSTAEARRPRLDKVRYLCDELHLDVNALDTQEKLPNHYGTPLCYAVRRLESNKRERVVETVQLLLERGADPTIKDSWGHDNAITIAEKYKDQHDVVLELLREAETKISEVKPNDDGRDNT